MGGKRIIRHDINELTLKVTHYEVKFFSPHSLYQLVGAGAFGLVGVIREIITKLKDGLYDIGLKNDEVVSSIIRSRQEWSSPEYDALPFKKAVEREGIEL